MFVIKIKKLQVYILKLVKQLQYLQYFILINLNIFNIYK